MGYEKSQRKDDEVGFSWTFSTDIIVNKRTWKRSRWEHSNIKMLVSVLSPRILSLASKRRCSRERMLESNGIRKIPMME